VVEMYGLDTTYYQIDILSDGIKSADITADQLTIRPLTPRTAGLFSVMADVKDGARTLESAQVRMKVRRFADVLVMLENVGRSQKSARSNLN